MNHAEIRKLVGDNYEYKFMMSEFRKKEIETYRESMLQQFATITTQWNDELHSEWTARMFLAAKMIYSSTLLLNTLDYSRQKNITITEPYLLYYSLLNCCRGLTFTLPTQLWRNGEILYDTHAKIINVASDSVMRLNKEKGRGLFSLLSLAKDYRELFSYRFPSDGLQDHLFSELNIKTIIHKCSLICEISQFTSELMEQSYNKNCVSKSYTYKQEILEFCFTYSGDSVYAFDVGDAGRVAYILRKVNRPHNIYHTMSSGMTDDFFGSWVSDEGDHDDVFNPDQRTITIFDLP